MPIEMHRCAETGAHLDPALVVQKQPWLPKVKDELGVAGGKFDFAALDMLAKEAAYKAAVEAMDSRGSRVDKSIIQKYERAEREIVSLTERQETLTRDRDTILKVGGPPVHPHTCCLLWHHLESFAGYLKRQYCIYSNMFVPSLKRFRLHYHAPSTRTIGLRSKSLGSQPLGYLVLVM
jgi:hypothetical protein